MKSIESCHKIGGWLVIAGLLFSIVGFGKVLWVTFFGANESMAAAFRDFVLSSRLLLLVFIVTWAERIFEIFRALSGKVSIRQSRIARSLFLRRVQLWLSVMFAWGSTSIATIYLVDLSLTTALISCALVFGTAMWILERRVAKSQIRA